MKYLILLLFMLNLTAEAETVYQWKNSQGNIEFSNEKPPLGVEFETIDMETRERDSAAITPIPATPTPTVTQGIPTEPPPTIVPSMTLETTISPEIPSSATQPVPSMTQIPVQPPAAPDNERYQRIRKDLYEICDHLTPGSTERRRCRADAKQIFHDKCHDKDTPVSELYRQAYCSLSDSYIISE
ncbi:MAG: hypothetical protein R3E08_01365 [Thiotrichaceae bacterium]